MTTPTEAQGTAVQIIRPASISATAARIPADHTQAAIGVSIPEQVLPVLTITGPDGSALHVALDGGRLRPLIATLHELAAFLEGEL